MYSDYSFVFDIDGTLCPIKKKEEKYEDLVPYENVLTKLRYYKEKWSENHSVHIKKYEFI